MKNIQLPIMTSVPKRTIVSLTIEDIVGNEHIPSDPPSTELITSIAEIWIQVPLVVCAADKIKGCKGKYFPTEGKRRVKSIRLLQEIGHAINGVPVEELQFDAVLRHDLTPETTNITSFIINNQRSANLITDILAVREVINLLGLDINDNESIKKVAQELRINYSEAKKIMRFIAVPEPVLKALDAGQISSSNISNVVKLLEIGTQDHIDEIVQRVQSGDKLSKKDIKSYSRMEKQEELEIINVGIDRTIPSSINPLYGSIEKLKSLNMSMTKEDILNKVSEALMLLETLI